MSSDDKTEPFWDIKPHRKVRRDIRQMKDNLNELEKVVETAEWKALGGRGHADVERAEKLCEAVEGSMSFILDDIRELPDTYTTDSD